MNLPNKLTILRVCMIPFFVAALLWDEGDSQTMRVIADVIFIAASLTDMLDGKIARKYNLVTNFGKIMDPFADKLLVLTALIYLAIAGTIPGWPVIIIIGRELLVTSLRALAADNGIILAARNLGKFKTVSQMLAIICLIIGWQLVGLILLYIAVALTIISLVDYLVQLSKSIKFN